MAASIFSRKNDLVYLIHFSIGLPLMFRSCFFSSVADPSTSPIMICFHVSNFVFSKFPYPHILHSPHYSRSYYFHNDLIQIMHRQPCFLRVFNTNLISQSWIFSPSIHHISCHLSWLPSKLTTSPPTTTSSSSLRLHFSSCTCGSSCCTKHLSCFGLSQTSSAARNPSSYQAHKPSDLIISNRLA